MDSLVIQVTVTTHEKKEKIHSTKLPKLLTFIVLLINNNQMNNCQTYQTYNVFDRGGVTVGKKVTTRGKNSTNHTNMKHVKILLTSSEFRLLSVP